MPTSHVEQQERRGQSHQMIDELVDVRTQMLSLYTELAARQPFNDQKKVAPLVEEFCQSLIDYTADAHFRLYRFLDEKKERRQKILSVADTVYPRIVESTQDILDFNDKYENDLDDMELTVLGSDLSTLGENLANRIELEDTVIGVMNRGRN